MALNALISYAYCGRSDLAALRSHLPCGRLMIDSGGFTAFTTGRTISVAEYADFLETWRGVWDHAITLDKIGDPVASRRQTAQLHNRGLPVLPVFTMGAKVEEFDAMVRDCGYVAVGGMVGVPRNSIAARVTVLQRRARHLGGGIHTLGVASMPTFRQGRPYSGDASTPSQVARFCNFLYFDGRDLQQVNKGDRKKLIAARRHLVDHGIEVGETLRTDRMPGGAAMERMRAGFYTAFACADEVLRKYQVPAPRGTTGAGSFLYCAISPHDMPALGALNARLHSPTAPPAWRRWGRFHQCEKTPSHA